MPMINIEDAYILGETGAQVDKVTGLFTKDEDTTEEEKTFAQLNIGASGGGGGGGRNLIDNAWFTINQRGATGASSGAYGLDRWFGVGTGYTVNSDGSVTVTGAMVQRNDWSFVWGKTVTISAMTADESVYSWTGTMATGTKSIGGLLNAVVVSSSQINFSAVSNLKALKLELGSVSTLANDAPPEYETELLKCQYYAAPLEYTTYSNPFTGLAASTTEFFVEAYLPRSMREISNPTISVTGTAYAIRGGTTGAITSWEAGAIKGNHIRLKGITTNLTANTQVPVYTAGQTIKIFVSADL